MAELASAERYAAVERFRGTMLLHSVVAFRNDRPGGPLHPGFKGDAWLGYVPIRMPDTICVEERLPPAAVGVLINGSHTDRDLFMPIDATEKRLLDAVAGRRNIGQILEELPPSRQGQSPCDIARSLFEKLWRWDQVVFDASRVAAPDLRGRDVAA